MDSQVETGYSSESQNLLLDKWRTFEEHNIDKGVTPILIDTNIQTYKKERNSEQPGISESRFHHIMKHADEISYGLGIPRLENREAQFEAFMERLSIIALNDNTDEVAEFRQKGNIYIKYDLQTQVIVVIHKEPQAQLGETPRGRVLTAYHAESNGTYVVDRFTGKSQGKQWHQERRGRAKQSDTTTS